MSKLMDKLVSECTHATEIRWKPSTQVLIKPCIRQNVKVKINLSSHKEKLPNIESVMFSISGSFCYLYF